MMHEHRSMLTRGSARFMGRDLKGCPGSEMTGTSYPEGSSEAQRVSLAGSAVRDSAGGLLRSHGQVIQPEVGRCGPGGEREDLDLDGLARELGDIR